MPVEIWVIALFVFMIIASVAALEMKDILSSIIAIGVVGLGVSMTFLFLQAPDLAIVQFLFEIFALIILLKAFVSTGSHQMEKVAAINKILVTVTVVFLAGVFVLSIAVFELLPDFGSPLMHTAQYYLTNGGEQTGAANLVSSVILDYRAYDTLGEVTVLFTAILGALAILKVKISAKGGENEQ